MIYSVIVINEETKVKDDEERKKNIWPWSNHLNIQFVSKVNLIMIVWLSVSN